MKIPATKVTTRWVWPFGEDAPEQVEMRRLSDHEVATINDKAGLRPGSERNSFAKQAKAVQAIGRASVVDWKGFTTTNDAGEEVVMICSDFNKDLFLDQMVEQDGERKSLWSICWAAFEEAEGAEAKN